MIGNDLARHYHVLSPWERLPLIIAAQARGDEVEADRLIRSAPRLTFQVSDHCGLAEGLDDLVKIYLIEQLDLATLIWRATALLAEEPLLEEETAPRWERLGQWVRLLAYRFGVQADGWKQLGAELHVDVAALLRPLPGAATVEEMEAVARGHAFSAEEALHFLSDVDGDGSAPARETAALPAADRLVTVAAVVRSMREYLQFRLDDWR